MGNTFSLLDKNQLKIIKEGVEIWNTWRQNHPDLKVFLSDGDFVNAVLPGVNFYKATLSSARFFRADLSNSNFKEGILYNTNFNGATLFRANFSEASLSGASFFTANLSEANLSNSNLFQANLSLADLRGADLSNCNLDYANLQGADLSGAILDGARLDYATLNEANIEQATFKNCNIYALSTWGMKGTPKEQSKLLITPAGQTEITVDDLQLGQFIYFLLNNQNVRNIIDTITSKVVLILGRFTDERKAILDAIREELRKLNFTPILFDFEKPSSKDVTGTVETLARLARFIIADLTDPSSIPHELATIIPLLRTTPVLPIKLQGNVGYSMFEDYQRSYPWVLKTYIYTDVESFLASLSEVITPANELAETFRKPF